MRFPSALVILIAGCSISESFSGSSEVLFESLTSPSGSSSAPGGTADADQHLSYRRDVRAYTVASLDGGDTGADYLRGVSRIAETHGISDWESTPATLVAIGEAIQDQPSGDGNVERLREDLDGLDPGMLALVFGDAGRAD